MESNLIWRVFSFLQLGNSILRNIRIAINTREATRRKYYQNAGERGWYQEEY